MGDRLNFRSTGPRMGPPSSLPRSCSKIVEGRGCHPAPESPLFPSPPGNTRVPLKLGSEKDLGPQGEQGTGDRGRAPSHSIGEKVPLGSRTELWGLARKSGLMR